MTPLPALIIVMGTSGCGCVLFSSLPLTSERADHSSGCVFGESSKSTVGLGIAEALGVPFVDGDDLHPAANVAKMSEGHPLTDEVRFSSLFFLLDPP
jgi:gluconokinase